MCCGFLVLMTSSILHKFIVVLVSKRNTIKKQKQFVLSSIISIQFIFNWKITPNPLFAPFILSLRSALRSSTTAMNEEQWVIPSNWNYNTQPHSKNTRQDMIKNDRKFGVPSQDSMTGIRPHVRSVRPNSFAWIEVHFTQSSQTQQSVSSQHTQKAINLLN